jgi:hypothetical protein
MKKLKYLFFISLIYACGSNGNKTNKIRLDENLTYKVFIDESLQNNQLIASVFETINETKTSTLNAQIEGIIVYNTGGFKFTGDSDTAAGLFSNITAGISGVASAINTGLKSGSFEVKNQLAILYDLEETFNKKVSSKINSNLKELAINLYPLEYLIEKNDILKLDSSKKTVKFFNSNLKLNEYLINDLVPAYRDVVKSFNDLHKTVVLNKLNKPQVDSLKLQILSFDDDFGPFENRGSIQNFKSNYLEFSKITDLKKSNISSELDFINEKTVNAINAYISLQNSKIKKMISFLGSNDLVSVRKVLVGDGPIVAKKAETYNSKIKVKKINKILSELYKY